MYEADWNQNQKVYFQSEVSIFRMQKNKVYDKKRFENCLRISGSKFNISEWHLKKALVFKGYILSHEATNITNQKAVASSIWHNTISPIWQQTTDSVNQIRFKHAHINLYGRFKLNKNNADKIQILFNVTNSNYWCSITKTQF